jgi:hypothetical protein
MEQARRPRPAQPAREIGRLQPLGRIGQKNSASTRGCRAAVVRLGLELTQCGHVVGSNWRSMWKTS